MPLTRPDRDALDAIIGRTATTLQGVLGTQAGDAVALLDHPSHQNAGDTFIWRGERAYLRHLGVRVGYAADSKRFDARALRRALPSAAPVLLNGGGNFGDLWPDFQTHREEVVSAFADRKVVQLPQSIWFDDPRAAKRANRIFGAHPDFTLMVRDSESIARCAAQLPDVRVVACADMAFGLGLEELPSAGAGWVDLLLLRRDLEVTSAQPALADVPGRRVDWGLTGVDAVAWKAARVPGRARSMLGDHAPWALDGAVAAGYDVMAELNWRSALRIFTSARRVLTDRLHAHVLACLLGLPHVVMDNRYGKVGALYRDHSHVFSTAHFVSDPAEAVETFATLGELVGAVPMHAGARA